MFLWDGLLSGLAQILRAYEGLLEPFVGQLAWGFSIILLTVTVRLLMLPLAIRQTKSMQAMQKLQPQLKKIQKKYEADRSMMKTDPDRYKKMKEKQREAQMALYQEAGVNPAGGCLPLILQMPIFFALFRILQPGNAQSVAELSEVGFFGIDSLANTVAGGAGIGAIALLVLQIGTTFYSTRQTQARGSQAAAEQQQAQKIMLYVMPVFLGYLSFTFPIGVVLYWVTTNVWTIGQQYIIFKQVEADEAKAEEERLAARQAARAERRRKASDGKGTSSKDKSKGGPRSDAKGDDAGPSKGRKSKGDDTDGGSAEPEVA